MADTQWSVMAKGVLKFAGNGWNDWSFVFRRVLKGMDKWSAFVNDPPSEADSAAYGKWIAENDFAYSALISCLAPHLLQMVKEFEYVTSASGKSENPRSAKKGMGMSSRSICEE